jgi:hypothetical protein
MAQQIQTLFIDDIDGGPAEGTVRFGLDGPASHPAQTDGKVGGRGQGAAVIVPPCGVVVPYVAWAAR